MASPADQWNWVAALEGPEAVDAKAAAAAAAVVSRAATPQSREVMMDQMLARLDGIDVLRAFDLDGSGTIHPEVLVCSLKAFDEEVFTDRNVRELLRGTGAQQGPIALKNLFGPFWRSYKRRVTQLQDDLALREREAAEASASYAALAAKSAKLEAHLASQGEAGTSASRIVELEAMLGGAAEALASSNARNTELEALTASREEEAGRALAISNARTAELEALLASREHEAGRAQVVSNARAAELEALLTSQEQEAGRALAASNARASELQAQLASQKRETKEALVTSAARIAELEGEAKEATARLGAEVSATEARAGRIDALEKAVAEREAERQTCEARAEELERRLAKAEAAAAARSAKSASEVVPAMARVPSLETLSRPATAQEGQRQALEDWGLRRLLEASEKRVAQLEDQLRESEDRADGLEECVEECLKNCESSARDLEKQLAILQVVQSRNNSLEEKIALLEKRDQAATNADAHEAASVFFIRTSGGV
mmetsp:Transcript_8284/g.18039  ORF Transcript_8284/g.18039 Transcript_8284/m.18039 type:complete len:495 (+) Transcript_8284:146-1630(+)